MLSASRARIREGDVRVDRESGPRSTYLSESANAPVVNAQKKPRAESPGFDLISVYGPFCLFTQLPDRHAGTHDGSCYNSIRNGDKVRTDIDLDSTCQALNAKGVEVWP